MIDTGWHLYLQRGHDLLFKGILPLIGFTLVALITTSRFFFRRYVGKSNPESLGGIRILTCGILLISTVWEDLASSALLPAELRHPMGVMRFFYSVPFGFHRFIASPEALTVFKWLTASILFLGMIGWRTRFVIPLGGFCYLIVGGVLRSYSQFFHVGLLPLYLMGILTWTPCGDGWSLDHLWRRYRGRPIPMVGRISSTYGWSRYACWVTIALTYEAAGLSKLRSGGLFWWDATNIRAKLYAGTLNPMLFDWGLSLRLTGAPDILFALAGIFVMLVELSFAMVLFSSTARRILPVAAMIMHLGMWFLQNVLFFDAILLQFAFFDFRGIQKALAQRLAGRGWIHALASRHAATHGFMSLAGDSACKHEPSEESGSRVLSSTVAPFRRVLFALGVSGLITVSLTVWLNGIEFYPFSGWQMYSYYSKTVDYVTVLARDESGGTSRAYFERAIPAVTDFRFIRAIEMCFAPSEIHICERFLGTIRIAMNRRAALGHKVTAFIIQRWSWDHRSNPSDPEHGKPISSFVFGDLGVSSPISPKWVK